MGLKNGNPFMTVRWEAIRSVSFVIRDKSFYFYTFVTDKGIFATRAALSEDENTLYYIVDGFEVDRFEIGTCPEDGTVTGESSFNSNTIEYIPKDLTTKNISRDNTI